MSYLHLTYTILQVLMSTVTSPFPVSWNTLSLVNIYCFSTPLQLPLPLHSLDAPSFPSPCIRASHLLQASTLHAHVTLSVAPSSHSWGTDHWEGGAEALPPVFFSLRGPSFVWFLPYFCLMSTILPCRQCFDLPGALFSVFSLRVEFLFGGRGL